MFQAVVLWRCYQAVPPKKNYVRGISYLTGYYVVAKTDDRTAPGCILTYITQSDPRGVFVVPSIARFFSVLTNRSWLGGTVPQ